MGLIQIVSILGTLFYLALIIPLVLKRKILEEYSILWLFFGFVLLLFSLWRDGLEILAKLMGVHYPPTALLLILVGALLVILVQFSVVISKISQRVIELTQELGITKFELEELKKRLRK